MANTLALLDRMKTEAPEIWSQAQVVGKWVWLEFNIPPIREIRAKLKELGFEKVLLLIEGYDEKLELAARNLPYVDVLPASAVDPVSLVGFENVLATVGAVRVLEEKLA